MVSNIFLLEVECRGDFDSIVSIFKTEMSAKSSNGGVKQKGIPLGFFRAIVVG